MKYYNNVCTSFCPAGVDIAGLAHGVQRARDVAPRHGERPAACDEQFPDRQKTNTEHENRKP